MRISDEVARTLDGDRAVVALESTIISHGLPHPLNVEVARDCEAAVRQRGAVPATIAVLGGEPVVGIGPDELEHLASASGIAKLSVRDLPVAAGLGVDGATTVAATAHLAALAGIRLFATGGLGGVHREAHETWDESADLAALSRIPVAVVCAGVKSILDVAATLERLETLGVPVIGYRTRRFPGFYLTDSGHDLDWSVESPQGVADVLRAQGPLGLGDRGVVIGNPLPPELQLDPALHGALLADGLAALRAAGVGGKDVTPFLLDHMASGSGGQTVEVNRRLVVANARLAAEVAVALAGG